MNLLENYQQERPFFRQLLKRDAQVQCSLTSSLDNHDGIEIRQQQILNKNSYDSNSLSPRYRIQLKLQPMQPNIYEAWNIETSPSQSSSLNQSINYREPSIRVRSARLISLSDDESDYNDYFMHCHCPKNVYLPYNVRMIHTRQDTNTISY